MSDKNGTKLNTFISNTGRRPARNFILERPGFCRCLRPENRRDSLFVIFDDILDSVVTYTNIQGRRLAKAKGFSLKITDRAEINAFLGLHVIAGKLTFLLPDLICTLV